MAENNNNVSETNTPEERQKLLESYVKRLSGGEDLESVRADFVKNFSDVDAEEIAKAEQSLIDGGAKINDVQRLCDVHSALFHGAAKENTGVSGKAAENTDEAGKASENTGDAANSVLGSAPGQQRDPGDARNQALAGAFEGTRSYQSLRETEGHPLRVFWLENEAIGNQIARMRTALKEESDVVGTLNRTRQIAVHYAKKGDLIYPVLKKDYDFPGPSEVMWGVDDEIRDELKRLFNEAEKDQGKIQDEKWQARLDKVLTRTEEMVFKENNILFPLCAKLFSEEVWKGIARDMADYEFCLIDPVPLWKEENKLSGAEVKAEEKEGEIVFPSGHLTKAQLEAMLNTIPLEITFIDENDINRYFNQNKEQKLFKRPLAALDREVYTCHPPKVEPMVRMVISELKSGKKDSVDIWNERAGEPVLIRYMAVRDKEGRYVGTMEVVQHMGAAKKKFS